MAPPPRIPRLSGRRVLFLATAFALPLAILNRVLRWLDNHVVDFDRPPYWPIGVFEPRWPGWGGLAVAAGCVLIFLLALRILGRRGYPLMLTTAFGLLLILGTNLIHGLREGFETPIGGGQPAIQYYHDSLQIKDAASFLAHYTDLQPTLLDHARTHPPGAVLTMYVWRRLIAGGCVWHRFPTGVEASGNVVTEAALIALVTAILSTIASACFFHGLLTRHIDDRFAVGWATFAFLLLPAVQIYYCASLDALIAAAFLGVIYFLARWCENPFSHHLPRESSPENAGARSLSRTFTISSWFALVAGLFAASFLTFAACFLLPVMTAYEYARCRSVRRTLSALIACAACYALLYALTGFNYAVSFRIASALENPQGFRLFADPVSYVFTRIECVMEILVFLGPFAMWAIYVAQSLGKIRPGRPSAVSFWRRLVARATPGHVATGGASRETLPAPLRAAGSAAVLTLLAMFLAGAFHTAETARACLFIYPFLMFPLAEWRMGVGRARPADVDPACLLFLVFGQALLMQMFAGYFW